MPLLAWYSQNKWILGNVNADVLLMSINACVCFTERVYVWCVLVAWLAERVRRLAGLCRVMCMVRWRDDVMWLPCFSPSSMLGQLAGNHLKRLLFSLLQKTSNIGGFLWKKTCPKEQCGMLKKSIFALFSCFSTVFLWWCILNAVSCVGCFCCWLFFFLFVQRKWWLKVVKDKLSTSQSVNSVPHRSLLLL